MANDNFDSNSFVFFRLAMDRFIPTTILDATMTDHLNIEMGLIIIEEKASITIENANIHVIEEGTAIMVYSFNPFNISLPAKRPRFLK